MPARRRPGMVDGARPAMRRGDVAAFDLVAAAPMLAGSGADGVVRPVMRGTAFGAHPAVTLAIRDCEMEQSFRLGRVVGGARRGNRGLEAGRVDRGQLGRGALGVDKAKGRVVASELSRIEIHD